MQCLIEDSVTSHLTVDFEKLQVFNQGSGDLIASAVQPESAVEQISNNSSLSSSPKSVLPEKVPVDQVSSWCFSPKYTYLSNKLTWRIIHCMNCCLKILV